MHLMSKQHDQNVRRGHETAVPTRQFSQDEQEPFVSLFSCYQVHHFGRIRLQELGVQGPLLHYFGRKELINNRRGWKIWTGFILERLRRVSLRPDVPASYPCILFILFIEDCRLANKLWESQLTVPPVTLLKVAGILSEAASESFEKHDKTLQKCAFVSESELKTKGQIFRKFW